MHRRYGYILLAACLFLLPVMGLSAQTTDDQDTNDLLDDDTNRQEVAETEDTIAYFQSTRLFNVPVLAGWQNESNDATALFTNDEYNATITTTAVDTDDAQAAIETVLTPYFDGTLPDAPLFTDQIALADGRWTQAVYHQGDITATALALGRDAITYVVAFIEDDPTSDIYMRITRNPVDEAGEADPVQGMQLALNTFLGPDFDSEPDDIKLVQQPSGEWLEYVYQPQEGANAGRTITAYGLIFGNATYATITVSDEEAPPFLANALNTTFLGFFTTPANDEYLWLGMASVFVILALLIGSYVLRHQSTLKDEALIEQLQDD